ncbi:hypothetical protein GCM10010421_60280 [Streptomyces glaucus]|uniref:Uncharacterized protein n=1 Tax=Streptomyces glaucus TaxID=284029 RepID=A0ABP5XN58_9ACTN
MRQNPLVNFMVFLGGSGTVRRGLRRLSPGDLIVHKTNHAYGASSTATHPASWPYARKDTACHFAAQSVRHAHGSSATSGIDVLVIEANKGTGDDAGRHDSKGRSMSKRFNSTSHDRVTTGPWTDDAR